MIKYHKDATQQHVQTSNPKRGNTMKKIIALLLLAVICFSFMACGGKENKKENPDVDNAEITENSKAIVGEWKRKTGSDVFVLNENGTGNVNVEGLQFEIKWKYDKELSCYIIAFDSGQLYCIYSIQTNGEGVRYISLEGYKFYYQD